MKVVWSLTLCGVLCGVCCRVVAPESASAFADLLTEVLFATPMRGSRTSEACRVLTVRLPSITQSS